MTTIESRPLTRRGLIAAGLAVGLTAARRRPEVFASGFVMETHRTIPADDGVALHVWVLSRNRGSGETIRMVWASVSGPSAGVSLLPVERRGPAGPLYASVTPPRGAVALVNGSFFEGQPNAGERPMGLVRIGGQTTYQPSTRTSGGFLIAGDHGVRVVPRADREAAEAADNAIESSPILIAAGASGMRRDDRVRADRAAVGALAGGGTAIVGAFAYGQDCVSLYEFEQLARAAATAVGAVFTDLLAMDGGPSAHIRLPRAGEFFGSSSSIYLTNVVALTMGD